MRFFAEIIARQFGRSRRAVRSELCRDLEQMARVLDDVIAEYEKRPAMQSDAAGNVSNATKPEKKL